MKTVKKEEMFRHIDHDFYNSEGWVDYHRLQKYLNVKAKTLAKLLDRTPRSLEKNPDSEYVQKTFRKIVFVISLLKEMFNSKEEALIWLKAPNPEFGGLSPWDIIVQREIDIVIDYLMDVRKGALT